MVDPDEGTEKVISKPINYETFSKAKRFSKGEKVISEYVFMLLRHYTGDETIGEKKILLTIFTIVRNSIPTQGAPEINRESGM